MRLEPIPQRFNPMIQLYASDVEGKLEFQFLTPSGQFWNSLSDNDKEKLRGIVARYGEDIEDYLHNMRQMLPRDVRR